MVTAGNDQQTVTLGTPVSGTGRHLPLIIFLVIVSTLYALTSSPYLVGGDNGEFATLYATGGVAHPSGFPLYLMILRAFSWLPVATPAKGAALVTAALGVAAVALLYAAALNWGTNRIAALLAAAVYAVSPLVWDLATHAEVFTLNAVLAAGILFACSPIGVLRGEARILALGLLCGLSLSNNLTLVFFAPLGLYGVALGVTEARQRVRAIALGVGALGLGLSCYLFLIWQAKGAGPNAWIWGDVSSPTGLLHHVLRRDYGSFDLTQTTREASALTQLGSLTRHLTFDLLGAPTLIALATLCLGVWRKDPSGTPRARWAAAALLATVALEGPVLAGMANVNPVGAGLAVVRRLYLLPELLLCFAFALGISPVFSQPRLPRLLRASLVPAVLCLGVIIALPQVQRERTATLENYLGDTLRTLPPNAVVLGSGDQRALGFAYAQLGLGLRRDVLFISPIMLQYDWYRQRASDALGAEIAAPERDSVNTVKLAALVLQTGRPLLLTDELNGAILKNYASFPIGLLIKILPPGEAPPAPEVLEAVNLALFEELAPSLLPPEQDSVWAHSIAPAYARPWLALAQIYEQLQQPEAARRCQARAQHFLVASVN